MEGLPRSRRIGFRRIAGLRRALGCSMIALLLLAGVALGQEETADPIDGLVGLVKQGKYADAESGARELLSEMESRDEAETAQAAAVLDVLVESLWRAGKVREEETRQLAQRALAVKERIFGEGHEELAESLNNLAVIDFFGGRFEEAEVRWKSALEIRTKALGPKHPDVAQMMNNLGNLYLRTGDLAAAKPMYDEALAIRLEVFGEEHPLVAQTLNNLATLHLETGDFAGALPRAERCVAIYENLLPAGHPKIAQALSTLARVLQETGESERAVETLLRAEKILEKAAGPDHPSLGVFVNNRAEELRKLGRLEEAAPLYERALTIFEKAYGTDHPHVAGCLGGMGTLAEASGDTDRAIELQRRTLAIKEKIMDPVHPRLALSLNDLGRLYRKVGDLEQAAPILERAVDIRRRSLGPDHPFLADSLFELAAVQAAQKNTAGAMAGALESERISREHLRLTGRSLSEEHALSYAGTRQRGLDLALSLAATGGLDAPTRRDVLDSLVRSRGIVLDGIAARHRTVTMAGDPEIVRLAEELASARTRLANLTVRGVGDLEPEVYRKRLDEARETKETAERALATASADFAAELERGRLGLADIEAHMPPGTALVAFAQYHDEIQDETRTASGPVLSYMAWVLAAGEKAPLAVPLGAAAEIEQRLAAWKIEAAGTTLINDPSNAEAEYQKAGSALREKVWDPVAGHLGASERVFIVPDGALNLVSLAALPAKDEGYLIEKGPLIHYLSAERDLVPAPGGESIGHGLLALGAPDYSQAAGTAAGDTGRAATAGIRTRSSLRSACAGFGAFDFEPLPAAAREAEQIAGLWRDAMTPAVSSQPEEPLYLTGAQASEAAFKRAAPGKRVLHLATHGFFLGGDCAPTASSTRGMGGLAMGKPAQPAPTPEPATPPASPEPTAMPVVDSPLLLSGLALAGANRRDASGEEEDGILTAEEIASLDLSGVELAVLSACDTGIGEIRAGEGVFGLRRAMQIAGVHSLVLSLWSVDDESTRAWMAALYRGLLDDGLDTAQAARAAGLAVLNSRRERGESPHPFFWAAFVAAGV